MPRESGASSKHGPELFPETAVVTGSPAFAGDDEGYELSHGARLFSRRGGCLRFVVVLADFRRATANGRTLAVERERQPDERNRDLRRGLHDPERRGLRQRLD